MANGCSNQRRFLIVAAFILLAMELKTSKIFAPIQQREIQSISFRLILMFTIFLYFGTFFSPLIT